LPKGRKHIELPSEKPRSIEKPIFISRPSVNTLHFYMDTFALKRFDDPEWDALGLVNSMLTATLNSRILGEARERGLVYSMSSSLDTTHDSSVWWFGAQVIPKNARALFSDKIGGVGILGDSKSRALVEPLNEIIQPLWNS
jgi:predicted Zn-dependent peptidase